MATVAERLNGAHATLMRLYQTIPVLTPCLDELKQVQADFVRLSGEIRKVKEQLAKCESSAERHRKQLSSVFKVNKDQRELSYQKELEEIRRLEALLQRTRRQRDDVVTKRLKLDKDRTTLLKDTTQLERVADSVFDRAQDERANTDFPEELFWQLELRECLQLIATTKSTLYNAQRSLAALSRAANLTEASLMAILGYDQEAFEVWQTEYALQSSRQMSIALRLEVSLSNAFSCASSARSMTPHLVPAMEPPLQPSKAAFYIERQKKYDRAGKSKHKYAEAIAEDERVLRLYITQLRKSHKLVERLLAQESQQLQISERYRDSMIPRLARIRRHVFQDYCLDGYQFEGWENEQGQSIIGSEADTLVRGMRQEPAAAAQDLLRMASGLVMGGVDQGTLENNSNASGLPVLSIPPGAAAAAPLSTTSPHYSLGADLLLKIDQRRNIKLAVLAAQTKKPVDINASAVANGGSSSREGRRHSVTDQLSSSPPESAPVRSRLFSAPAVQFRSRSVTRTEEEGANHQSDTSSRPRSRSRGRFFLGAFNNTNGSHNNSSSLNIASGRTFGASTPNLSLYAQQGGSESDEDPTLEAQNGTSTLGSLIVNDAGQRRGSGHVMSFFQRRNSQVTGPELSANTGMSQSTSSPGLSSQLVHGRHHSLDPTALQASRQQNGSESISSMPQGSMSLSTISHGHSRSQPTITFADLPTPPIYEVQENEDEPPSFPEPSMAATSPTTSSPFPWSSSSPSSSSGATSPLVSSSPRSTAEAFSNLTLERGDEQHALQQRLYHLRHDTAHFSSTTSTSSLSRPQVHPFQNLGDAPLIPTYEMHTEHLALDPVTLSVMSRSAMSAFSPDLNDQIGNRLSNELPPSYAMAPPEYTA